MNTRTSMLFALAVSFCLPAAMFAEDPAASFPRSRPAGGSFSRPEEGALLDVSPPGFSWWRAAPAGRITYRLTVLDAAGSVAFQSDGLDDPVCVPDRALPAGSYTWTVQAVDRDGAMVDTTEVKRFEIADPAIDQPWVAAEVLLQRVPAAHPRLLFPKARMDQIRGTLKTTRREAFESLRRAADSGLRMAPPAEPDYDQIQDASKRRLAYVASFADLRRYHLGAMQHTALMYALSGEREYGLRAKAMLLSAAEWDPEGISSIMAPYGDEIGLGLVKSEALTYDWIYDLLDADERSKAEAMLVARADQMIRRLQRRDFLSRPESSHDGRLPGYLLEHAIALAEHPRASVWMDYALKAILTVFPHWAGRDGGWAEGISYGMAYNTIFITPLESLRIATGFDVWQRSFYRKLPYFFFYNVSPSGEIVGFGDSYDKNASGRSSSLRTLMQFHAERTGDPALRGWVDLLRTPSGSPPSLSAIVGLINPQTLAGNLPADLSPDAVFQGVGWAALHSDLAHPEDDLFVAFKSSPYGGVSHSYADQNGFALLKGGHALARPGGSRYPHHGTPFHTRYTQQTVAQCSILVDGHGQINRNADANGQIVAFDSQPHIGYVCGEAQAAYGERLTRFRRHVILIRPSLVCIVDDLAAPAASEFQWLMHAPERLELDEEAQTLVSRRDDARMEVQLFTPGGFAFSQTDQWPMDPKTGYPTVNRPDPPRLWHFTASTRKATAARRIAAIMNVGTNQPLPPCTVHTDPSGHVLVETTAEDVQTTIEIHLTVGGATPSPIVQVQCQPPSGQLEQLSID